MKHEIVTLDKLQWINSELPQLGFSHFGASQLQKPLSFEHYQTWLENGHHADMMYLKNHELKKENPTDTFNPALSALVFAAPYFPHPEMHQGLQQNLKKSRVAMYAKGSDYHYWLKDKLQKIVDKLKVQFPNESFLIITDSAPLLERDLAYQAGLGWFGKNSCLIHPKKGSLFLLGEILTSLNLKSELAKLPDFCGTCQRCIEICPTQALTSAKKLDARKCISYWTIESRDIPPENLREKFGDWLFGCDLCQTVCPWNEKLFKNQLSVETKLTLPQTDENNLSEELQWILATSGKQIEKALRGSPLLRAGPTGLKRNALIIIANRKMKNLTSLVESFCNHQKLSELAHWTLSKLNN